MLVRNVERTTRLASRAGFTLMELLVVVAILVVLMGVSFSTYMYYTEHSKLRTAKAGARLLAGDLKAYAASHENQYPPENSWDLLPLPPERKPPMDPWRRPFQWMLRELVQPDGISLPDPVVWSTGPRGDSGPDGELSSISP